VNDTVVEHKRISHAKVAWRKCINTASQYKCERRRWAKMKRMTKGERERAIIKKG
jgi:hypothetical protein